MRLQMSAALCKYGSRSDSCVDCEAPAVTLNTAASNMPTYQTHQSNSLHSVTQLFDFMRPDHDDAHAERVQASYFVFVGLTSATCPRAEQTNCVNGGTTVTSVLIERVSTWHTTLYHVFSVLHLCLLYYYYHSAHIITYPYIHIHKFISDIFYLWLLDSFSVS